MSTEYQNKLTDWVKRVRPLLVSISTSVTNTIINTTIGTSLGYAFVPALGGYDGTNLTNWLDASIGGSNIAGVNIEVDGATAGGVWAVPNGVATVTAIPVIANNGAGQTIEIFFSMQSWEYGSGGSHDFDSVTADHVFSAGDLEWLTGHSNSFGVTARDVLVFLTYSNETNDDLAVWGWLLTLT